MSVHIGLTLAVLSVAAFAAPLVAERTGIPSAVLELIVGLGLGFILPSATYASGTFIASLGSLGFMILMFLVGAELDIRSLWRGSRVTIVAGFALFAVSLGFSEIVLGHVLGASPLWVLSGAATSVGLTAPILNARGWMGTEYATEQLLLGSVAEFIYVVCLAFVSVSPTHGWRSVVEIGGLRSVGIVAVALVMGLAVRRIRRMTPRHFHRWFRRDDPIEIGLRGTFALLFFLVAASSFIKIPDVMGALLAGLLFRAVIGHARAIIERLTSVANSFFIPLFFLTVGLRTPLRPGLVSLLPLVGLVLVVLLVPRLAFAGYFAWRGASARLSLSASLLLMAPLTLLITTAEIGQEVGLISARNGAAMVVTATLSALLFPVLAERLLTAPPDPAAEVGGDLQTDPVP